MPGPAGDIFGAPVPLLDCNGIIDPSTFPVPTADQVYIGDLASDLRKAGEDMAQTGDDVVSTWGGLAGCYTAPESDTLFSALDPVSSDGEEVETGTDRAASALHDFAEELREVKLAWADLTRRAQSFRDSVIDDPEWDKADNFITGRSDNVEENNDIKIAAESIIVRYEKAQRECANAINQGIYGRTRFHSRFDEELGYIGANGFIFDTVNRNTDLPSQWGEGASADKFWYQDAWDAGMDFGLGAIEGVGGMVGAHSAEGWFAQSWGDSLKEYHWDNITAAASLVGAYDAESNSLTRPGSEPAGEAWKELAHSIVPWTEFADRPGYVFATAALNIGGTVVGVALTATGVGSVVGIPLLLWRGASILDGMGTPGRGGLGTDVDLSQLPELPDVNGQNAPVVRLDAEDMEAMGLSPSQIAEIEADLRRVMEEQGVGAGGSGPSQDPRVSDTLAFDDIVNHPDNASFGNQVRGENRQGIDEADQAAKTDPTRTPSSEEGSWTAGEVLDGPEGDGARVQVGAGGRGGDSLSESANPTPPPTRADLSGDGSADLNGGRPGNEPDGGNGNRGPDLADNTPTATNQDGGGPGPGTHNDSSNPTITSPGTPPTASAPTHGTGGGGDAYNGNGAYDGDGSGSSSDGTRPSIDADGRLNHPANSYGSDPRFDGIDPSKDLPGGSLQASEDLGGHAIERHVDKSTEYLQHRTLGTPGYPGSGRVAGSYRNIEIAEWVTSVVLDMRKNEISDWLNGDTSPPKNHRLSLKDVEVEMGEIGYGVSRIGSLSNPLGWDPVVLRNATMVLEVDSSASGYQYKILTSYPTPAAQDLPASNPKSPLSPLYKPSL